MVEQIKYSIGVDLGGTNIKLGIVTNTGKIIKKISVDTKAEGGSKVVISQIKYGIDLLLKGNKYKIQGIGIGSPGVVSMDKGTVENPPNLPGWKKVFLRKELEKITNTKVVVENDANAAAIGELIYGAGKKLKSFVMITLGTGVGGGLIINRKLYRGDTGAGGEIGHIVIDLHGKKCNCGNTGCVEAYLGNGYLINAVKEELPNYPDSKINKLINNDTENLTPKVISEAVQLNDKYANEIVKNMGENLGAALATVSNILDITNFVIGGGVSGFGKPLFDATSNATKRRVLASLSKYIKIIPAKLKNEAGIQGAAALVYYLQ
ncbi:MAG: ROK family protein [Bacteroidota bacterium]|nr:ROK family protein [Bacteroidota bacterium]